MFQSFSCGESSKHLIFISWQSLGRNLTHLLVRRCNNFSKRTANCHVLLEHGDATWESNTNFSVISGSVFEKMNPPLQTLYKSTTTTPYARISYETLGTLNDIKSFSDLTGEWLTMEGTIPPCKTSDCQGHFHNNPTLPHSFMLIPNVGTSLLPS